MARPTRDEMLARADRLALEAARHLRVARHARRAAANPSLADTTRQEAAGTILDAERHAQECLTEADSLRRHLPGEDS